MAKIIRTGKRLGPSFPDELRAANTVNGVGWNARGQVTLEDDSMEVAVLAVVAAHDRTTPALPDEDELERTRVLDVLGAQLAKVDSDDDRRTAIQRARTYLARNL